MKGHIRQRSRGSWAIVIDVGRDPATGKRRQQWHTIKGSKKYAERRLRELLTSIEAGTYVEPTKLTVGDFLQKWLHDYAAVSVRARTFERYQSIIRCHLIPTLGNIPLNRLQPSHIQACHAAALSNGRLGPKTGGLSHRTVAHHHRVLNEALSHAVKWGLVARNAAQAIDAPRWSMAPIRTLDIAQIQVLLREAGDTIYHALFHLAIYRGLRRSELLALRWKQIDLDMAVLHVVQVLHRLNDGRIIFDEPKSRNGRRPVALSPEAVLSLRAHRECQERDAALLGLAVTDETLVFSQPEGTPLLPDSVSHAFTRIAKRAGISGVRFHDLRHTHATLMLQQGIHPKIVSERLGHGSVAITLDTYSHVVPGLQEAAAQRFDEALSDQRNGTVPIIGGART